MNKRLETASIPADDAHGRRKHRSDESDEDQDLVQRARAGDNAAFQMLFERHHRRAYSLAFGMVKNQADALDVVQDAFIKAHRYLGNFKGTSSFYTWLYRIVMNVAIDHIRKHKRARHVDFNDAIAHVEGNAPVGEESLLPKILGQDPGKALVRKEIREHIGLALAELTDNHRSVLIMRELEGLSYEQMAEAMDCSKGTIMSRLFHARKNMQQRLLELMGGEKDLDA